MQDLIQWMQGTWLAKFMAESEYAWGWTEVLHFIGMSMLFGSVLIMDARLMGFFRTTVSIRAVQGLARLAAAGFAINLLTGIVFLVKDAHRLLPNPAFQLKMVFVIVAGLNFMLFMALFGKKSMTWRDDENPPALAKMVAVVSIAAWVLVIWAGRMIPVYGEG